MKQNDQPPGWALRFFRWFCHKDLREELEGDLVELYNRNRNNRRAFLSNVQFIIEVLVLIRPSVITNGSIKYPDMKTWHWIQLGCINVLIALCIFLPVLPGPFDQFALALSNMAQLLGFLGLAFVPIGIFWLIAEIKKRTRVSERPTNWTNGYFFGIISLTIGTLIALFFSLAFAVGVGFTAGVVSLVVIGFAIHAIIPKLNALKNPDRLFNSTPLYLMSVPLIALTMRVLFFPAATDLARARVIQQAGDAIASIERYYDRERKYPDTIDDLNLPRPTPMGIDKFQYERNGNGYDLYFVQWQHFGATKEVVMYNKEDRHSTKGYFKSFQADQAHWKYFWLD